ncbi:MAG: cation transporter [Planctomycetes bacterium]|nr:cation transporter [Planctomycetota bacterium]
MSGIEQRPMQANDDHHVHHAALARAFGITAALLVVEFVGGILTNSLALLSDAGHMLSDVLALGLALIASRLAQRAPSARHSYGLGRAKVLAALLNGLGLCLIVGIILWEAIGRLARPPEVKAEAMLAVAVLGLLANAASAAFLFRHRHADLNLRGAFLHVASDSLGSLGAIIAGVAMIRWGLWIADPLTSVAIALLILWGSVDLVRRAVHVLLEGTPDHVTADGIRGDLAALPGVIDCHDLHIWSVGPKETILTVHLHIGRESDPEEVLRAALAILTEKHGIDHATVQVETDLNHPPAHE